MGDISTHKEIVLHMIPQLKQISAAENYTYVEFGNFLTDVSQFRDPVAYIGAKSRLRTGALVGPLGDSVLCGELNGFLGSGNLDGWLHQIFGFHTPDSKRHGALPEFFRHLSRAVAHMRFSATSQQQDPNLTPLSPAEIDRVFAASFTQYYPHEHVDYPPLINIKDPDVLPAYRPGGRSIFKYLERHIEFISTELSKIEYDWLQNRTLPATDPVRCDLLVWLGHILHAVEDFFFHSNVVELRQWRRVVKANPGRRPNDIADDYHFIVDNSLTGSGHNVADVRLRRRLARRLRYPRFDDESGPGPLIGQPQIATRLAVDFAFTGGFGSDDVAHTISSALEGFEESLQESRPDVLAGLQQSQVPLVQLLFTEQLRRAIAGSCAELNTRSATHKQQVTSGLYAPLFDAMQTAGVFTAEAKSALIAAFNLDREVVTAFPGKPGPGGFLIVWLRMIQKEADASHAKADALDADAQSPYDPWVSNGASEETVGSHSLLAKDGVAKEPLRKHAMALAKCASAALAVTLRKRIEDDPSPATGIDWDPILRHFMRIPPDRTDTWEEQVLAALTAGAAIPPLSSLTDRPPIVMMTQGGVAARRARQSRSEGENFYRKFEAVVSK